MKKHQKKVTKKLIAVILIMALVVGITEFIGNNSVQASSSDSLRKTSVNLEGNKVIAKEEVEGFQLTCKCDKITGETVVYVDEEEYQVQVGENGDINIKSLECTDKEVKGQSVALASGIFITTEVITLVCKVLCVALGAITATAIVRTCNKYKVNPQLASTIATVALANNLSKNKKSKDEYFIAEITKDKKDVFVYRSITYQEALSRLRCGKDVMASNRSAAQKVAIAASPTGQTKHHSNEIKDGYFPHYHPVGRAWISNKAHMPHCWYFG